MVEFWQTRRRDDLNSPVGCNVSSVWGHFIPINDSAMLLTYRNNKSSQGPHRATLPSTWSSSHLWLKKQNPFCLVTDPRPHVCKFNEQMTRSTQPKSICLNIYSSVIFAYSSATQRGRNFLKILTTEMFSLTLHKYARWKCPDRPDNICTTIIISLWPAHINNFHKTHSNSEKKGWWGCHPYFWSALSILLSGSMPCQ